MDNIEVGARRRRKPIRFSLAALLVLITGACVLLAVFRPSPDYVVTASVRVSHPNAISSNGRLSPQDLEEMAIAMVELAKSSEVLDAALSSSSLANLGVLVQRELEFSLLVVSGLKGR